MSNRQPRRRRRGLLVAAVSIPLLLIALFAFSLLNTAGRLPWQEDPTRIPITPFADIPGNGLTGDPSPTPEAGTPAALLPATLAGRGDAVPIDVSSTTA